MIYIITYRVNGKKVQAEVEANSEEEAKRKVINRIKFKKRKNDKI